ncbi:unnamed protein product [Arctogadus glacialis]
MSMNKYSLGLLRHGPSWETNARRVVQTILEKYSVEHIPMEAEVWQEVKGSCPEVNVATVLISFKLCSSELVVVGRWEEVETLVKAIKSKMEKARDELHVVNNTIEKEIQFDSKEMLDLTLDLVRDELVNVDLSKKDEYPTIHLKGLSEKVQMAETLIQKVQDTLTSKKIDSSQNLILFLQSIDLEKFQNDHFSLDNIVAVVICTKQFVSVLAKKGDIDRAEKKLKKVIKQEALSISRKYNKESFDEQWKTFHAALKKELESTQNSQNVLIEFSGDKIELCGFSSVVDDVIAKVKAFLENKKVVTEDVPLKTLQEVVFVESFMKLSADLLLKALGVTILPCRSPQSPCLQVTATSDQIKEAIDVVNRHIRRITTRKYMYSKAGEAKILKNNKSLLKMEAKSLGFNLELSATLDASQTLALPSLQVSNTIVIGRVSVILKKADITKEIVDVIVNSSNQNLDLNTGCSSLFFSYEYFKGIQPCNKISYFTLCFTGVSGEILKAAGQSVVDECKKNGPQPVGNVVLTGGGSLNCKHIAHIAGAPKVTASILKVLQLCESKQASTVSIPTIGTGRGGCLPEDSAKAILQGLRQHILCTPLSSLKTIFVVAIEDRTYDSLKKYFNKPRYSKTLRAGIPMMAVPVALPLNQVKIKDALINLKQGNITAETVKAIVNSTNEDVNLKNGPLRGNDAGVTSGGRLQCDFIIHIVGPRTAEQAVERVKNVLKHCEDRWITSVSFPAIGTGHFLVAYTGTMEATTLVLLVLLDCLLVSSSRPFRSSSGGCGMKFTDSVTALLLGIETHLSKHKFSALKQIFLVVDQVKAMQEGQQVLQAWTQDTADDDDSSNDSSCDEDGGGKTC